ncbi:glycosyltransferase [Thalassospira lucentensis]|jgi:glycosyltransferase involved in cell wall biosynthesis|uniref:Glycosyltransferase family 1 protein n=2 Tax=Thalassospira lucentensis TaxID=168935 RepID=A0A358HQF0_9PROT|nr:glycosyltransferase family 1 protein [Thalassospira lucentensis]HBU97381.1 glycosyltransferase family 1 protein [Thalassospira lucentensis]|tara:strand:+ start:515 stop:1555 length:1041 start_codon:yes stop_codon:yes gene_type:complete
MKILMLDHSIGFDPKDREARPLGTTQRAFIALAEALVARGHKVEARRNGGIDKDMHGVAWRQLDAELPPFGGDAVDTVIAWRDPALLSHASIPADAKTILWFDGDPTKLNADDLRLVLHDKEVQIVFTDDAQKKGFETDLVKKPIVVKPGAVTAFTMASNMHWAFESREEVAVTVANTTTGIAQIVRIWEAYVAPKAPKAILEIYAYDLFMAMAGENDQVSDDIVDLVRSAIDKGVRVLHPKPEGDMAETVANARAFLHHGKYGTDYAGQWIVDALGAATPVVSYGGIAKTRVEDGKTGYIVPDEAAYGNITWQLLTDRSFFSTQSEAARNDRREWIHVAGELEKI